MPIGKYIAVGVFVDDKKLPEYQIKNKIYTEVSLCGPTSYIIEEDGQKYPVQPFKVKVDVIGQEFVWITIFLDGQKICSRPVGCKFTCDGVKVGDEIRELLFTLPRIIENQEKENSLAAYAGTLKVVVWRAVSTGMQLLPMFTRTAAQNSASHGNVLQHFTKKDVQKSHSHDTGGLVVREGKPTINIIKTNRFRCGTGFASSGEFLEELTIHYRPCIYSTTVKESCVLPVSTAPALKVEKTEEDEDGTKTNNEDSILYMGDDDCHIVDVAENFSLIELDRSQDEQ